jgi:hypothetical protein
MSKVKITLFTASRDCGLRHFGPSPDQDDTGSRSVVQLFCLCQRHFRSSAGRFRANHRHHYERLRDNHPVPERRPQMAGFSGVRINEETLIDRQPEPLGEGANRGLGLDRGRRASSEDCRTRNRVPSTHKRLAPRVTIDWIRNTTIADLKLCRRGAGSSSDDWRCRLSQRRRKRASIGVSTCQESESHWPPCAGFPEFKTYYLWLARRKRGSPAAGLKFSLRVTATSPRSSAF